MITNEFPPGKVGNDRIIKFAKFLPHFGWEPQILTIARCGITEFDYSLESNVPDNIKVWRAFYPNFEALLIRVKGLLKKKTKNETVQITEECKQVSSNKCSLKRAIISSIKFILKKLLIPEELITWFPFAIFKGVRVCHKNRINLIFSSAPFYTNHLIGLGIKMLTGKKWVADYRNLWIDNPLRKHHSIFHKKIEEGLDRTIMKRANKIVVITEGMRNSLIRRYPFVSKDKIITIDNGYDLTDFRELKIDKEDNSKTLSITYTGAIYRDYPTPEFLEVIGELINERQDMGKRLKINLVGPIKQNEGLKIKEVIKKFNLFEIVFFENQVSRQKALEYQINSHILLLMSAGRGINTSTVVPGKLFDYIGAEKPIIAIIPDGDCARIVREGNLGWVVDANNSSKMRDIILEVYQKWTNDELKITPDWDYLKRFDRRNLTGRLAYIFDNLIRQN